MLSSNAAWRNEVLQRGRKSVALRSMIPLAPHLDRAATPHHLAPPPPKHLGGPEQEKIWNIAVRQYNFTYIGLILLENALHMHARAAEMKKIIDRDGPWIAGRGGLSRKHPLLSLEARCRQTFY